MKFTRNDAGVTCRLQVEESHALLALLSHYPVRIIREPRLSDDAKLKEDTDLLKTALIQNQQTNESIIDVIEKQLLENVSAPRFKLTHEQAEMFLQVLNDLRVGYWEQLGHPRLEDLRKQKLDEAALQKCWVLEVCGYVQVALIKAGKK